MRDVEIEERGNSMSVGCSDEIASAGLVSYSIRWSCRSQTETWPTGDFAKRVTKLMELQADTGVTIWCIWVSCNVCSRLRFQTDFECTAGNWSIYQFISLKKGGCIEVHWISKPSLADYPFALGNNQERRLGHRMLKSSDEDRWGSALVSLCRDIQRACILSTGSLRSNRIERTALGLSWSMPYRGIKIDSADSSQERIAKALGLGEVRQNITKPRKQWQNKSIEIMNNMNNIEVYLVRGFVFWADHSAPKSIGFKLGSLCQATALWPQLDCWGTSRAMSFNPCHLNGRHVVFQQL